MSLLTEAWMPVRDRSGVRRWIAPTELADPDLVCFDAERADFNGALAQFAIGLLNTFNSLANTRDWERYFISPPNTEALQAWWAGREKLFEYEGDGPRFLQDLTVTARPEWEISALLIDSPGDNALENNSDHFVKRTRIGRLCPHCAMTALLTLQINAPAGGRGHRTGLRGGGPLTTLLTCQPTRSLWHDLWLNVIEPPERDSFGGDAQKTEPHFQFPWLAPIEAIQSAQGQTTPIQVHPLHIHWAMPRRIRLDFDCLTQGTCDICHRSSERLLSQYATVPNGLNYKGPWDHVLSPYYLGKNGWLPTHPQPGGIGYRYWLPWLVGMADKSAQHRPARVVVHFYTRRRARLVGSIQSLWAFGYDFVPLKPKPRCWYEARLPVYNLDDCKPDAIRDLQVTLQTWLHGASDCADALCSAVMLAKVGPRATGDFSAVDAAFWSRTEAPFYALLQDLISALHSEVTDEQLVAFSQSWLRTLQTTCKDLFESVFVGTGQVERKKPSQVAQAHKLLWKTLGGSRLRDTLKLPIEAPPSTVSPPRQTTP